MDPLRKPQPQPQGPELVHDSAAPAGGLQPAREPALSYTPRPELSGRAAPAAAASGKAPLLAALLALALLAGAGAWLAMHAGATAAPPHDSAQVRVLDDNKLIPSAPDLDEAATRSAREQLARGETPPSLKGANEQTLRDLRDGRAAIYKVFIYAQGAAAGARATASVGGATVGEISLAAGGTVQIPLSQGVVQSLTIRVTGTTPVPVHAKTSTGSEVTSTLAEGNTVNWDVVLR